MWSLTVASLLSLFCILTTFNNDDGLRCDNCVSVDKGSVDGADGAPVDEGSVDAADGAAVDNEISVGGELVVLVPIGGGVVDAVASIVPVGAGTCLRAPLFADDEDDDESRNPFFMINSRYVVRV